jgi:hypothetical protein
MLPMNLRSLIVAFAPALVLSLAPAALHAQTGLYLNPIAQRISNSTADKGTFAFLGQNSKSQMFYGPQLGAYYDFKTPYAFKAGIDLRDSIMHGAGAGLNSFLVGVRISGKPFGNALKPYLEPVVGVGSSRAPFTTFHVKKAEYGAYAGLDYETHHHLDFRLVEFGYTSLITVSSETVGGTATIPAANILSVSTGLVLRFP